MLIIDLLLFGAIGAAVWAVQMVWIPFWAAGVVNGIGHWWGYRNFETRRRQHQHHALGRGIGGEELHNNHHAYPTSAKFSIKPYEFDIGWVYIRALEMLGPGHRAQDRAPGEARSVEVRSGRRHAPGRHRAPLRRARELREVDEGKLRRRARRAAREGPRHAARSRRCASGCTATRATCPSAKRWAPCSRRARCSTRPPRCAWSWPACGSVRHSPPSSS